MKITERSTDAPELFTTLILPRGSLAVSDTTLFPVRYAALTLRPLRSLHFTDRQDDQPDHELLHCFSTLYVPGIVLAFTMPNLRESLP